MRQFWDRFTAWLKGIDAKRKKWVDENTDDDPNFPGWWW
jgi:hypothetical protein